ncbi:hypothetical protein [Fusobacterium ulcerans]|uniref:hypothetical protein n=1 Tax=Fusobacterium ulcerans TaxID=861 RepID=UPI00241C0821|nr:hypothetical protein [Fusobacterium ulcerans]
MASFTREEKQVERSFKRLQPDMRVILGAGEIKHLQPLAQDKTDGKFYAYVSGDANKGVITGLYTGETITAEDGTIGYITTQALIPIEDIQGISWESDFTALSQLKLSGIIISTLIEGTKEA